MKSVLRLGLSIFFILGMLFAAFPASAGASRTEVTGKFFFVDEPAEHPRARLWTTGQFVDHCRNDIQLFYFETDYEALNGWGQAITHCEFHYAPNFALKFAHIWGTTTITSDLEGTDVLWECTGNGVLDAQWWFDLDYVCHGYGVNKGLLGRFSIVGPIEEEGVWYYPLAGEILEVGGE